MKKILVISDNYALVKHFQYVEKKISSKIALFTYCYSAINKSTKDLESLGMSVIDLKNTDNVDSIILNYDLVISAHCKQIFPKILVRSVRCINIHPGLNPHNRGWFPQVFSIINKKPIGCTIHVMDEEIDHGDIIYQQELTILESDTSLDVYTRVVEAEKSLIDLHIVSLINEEYTTTKLTNDGNYNGIQDFNTLRCLDLESKGTLREHLDLLRALSHGAFRNAYFLDQSGNKIFVRLILERDI